MFRRVVITGIGAVTPIGLSREAFWDGCLQDKTAVTPIPDTWKKFANLNSGVWAPLAEVDYPPDRISRIEAKQLDVVSKNCLNAAFEAVDHAGFSVCLADARHRTYRLDNVAPDRVGVYMGTGVGGIHTLGTSFAHQICSAQAAGLKRLRAHSAADLPELKEILTTQAEGLLFPKRFNPYTVSMLMPNAPAANVAIKLGLKGANLTYPLACASGTAAVGHGFREIRSGEVDVAVTGGTEYLYDAYGTIFRAFDAVKALAHDYEAPELANRPFDAARSGFLFSQGGSAVLVLEELTHALERGRVPLAEILSYAESCDAKSIMMMDAESSEIDRMLDNLFEGTGVSPHQVDYVNAHGTGTEQNDLIESSVIARRFRPEVLVNSTKALIGHTMGASGAIEAAVTALSLRHQATHGIPNLSSPVADLNFIRHAGPADMDIAVSESFAFGGHNTALLMKRFTGDV